MMKSTIWRVGGRHWSYDVSEWVVPRSEEVRVGLTEQDEGHGGAAPCGVRTCCDR